MVHLVYITNRLFRCALSSFLETTFLLLSPFDRVLWPVACLSQLVVFNPDAVSKISREMEVGGCFQKIYNISETRQDGTKVAIDN